MLTLPSRMLSSTVSVGTRLSSCSTTASPAACAWRGFFSVTGFPLTKTSPWSGKTAPASTFTSVLLPAPL